MSSETKTKNLTFLSHYGYQGKELFIAKSMGHFKSLFSLPISRVYVNDLHWCHHPLSSVRSAAQSCLTLWLYGPQHARLPCLITNSWSLLKLTSIESVMPSNHLILCRPLLLLPSSFPASGSSPMSQFFVSCGPSIGASASASVLPMNIQDWSPLGWTGWISLQSKGLSEVFSNTTVQKHQFSSTQLSL